MTDLAEQPDAPSNGRFDLYAYLERIGYEGSREPTAETLVAVHRAHRRSVPYENLDVALRRPISHEPAALFEKVVGRRRGGWCHELNRLFALALLQMGFKVSYRSAQVWASDGSVSPEFSHLVLVVALEERWLADVGFGARGPSTPLRLDHRGPQESDGDLYRVRPGDDGRTYADAFLRWQSDWAPLYSFLDVPRALDEFEERSRAQLSEPFFTDRYMVSRATPEGRVSLDGRRLITTRGDAREERVLTSDDEWRAAIKDAFGIDLG
jgi:N-hydroxyarylamine O-acetyltransferase